MECEVIVVGGGIGGLTTAALLAARGMDVCLFERQSYVGGCLANFDHLGYSFDPTFGLYSGWESGGTWERVFAELPVSLPHVTKLSPSFVVRLANGRDVRVPSEAGALEEDIAHVTPWFTTVRDETWAIAGGAQALADRLAQSFKQSGGKLRSNSTVLRLAYRNDGLPIGVDLLTGERVFATRAIVSNLTVWDTYGKLIGLSRTPKSVSTALKQMTAWGVYQIFVGLDEPAAARLPAERMIIAAQDNRDDEPVEPQHLLLNVALQDDRRAPADKRAATVTTFTQADEWFAFHEDATWHEGKDQTELEKCWARLHAALPELADGAEVIETASPQTYYENTRRKLGMIGPPSAAPNLLNSLTTPFQNLFLVGDTVSGGIGIEGLARSAIHLSKIILN